MEGKQHRSGGLRAFNSDSEGFFFQRDRHGGKTTQIWRLDSIQLRFRRLFFRGVNMEAKQHRSGGLRAFNSDSEGFFSAGQTWRQNNADLAA